MSTVACVGATRSSCSSPDIPGMRMSAIRQAACRCSSEPRNSSADPNARALNPASFNRPCRALRIKSSSSMMATKEAFRCRVMGIRIYGLSGDLQSSLRMSRLLEPRGHSDQFGERLGQHFPHHVSALDFHGDFTRAKRRGDLLVQKAGYHQAHHLALAPRERGVALMQDGEFPLVLARLSVAVQRQTDRIEQGLIVEGFGQELDRPRLHRLDCHRNVAVTRNEDDWNLHAGGDQLALNIDASRARKPYVEDEACRPVTPGIAKEF